jgi:hypothetical protein
MLAVSGINRVLLQDGIGAGKRTPSQAATTARAFTRTLRASGAAFGVIVELFDIRRTAVPNVEEPATTPASITEIQSRLEATAGFGTIPATSFSHVHDLTWFGGPAAARRGTEWLQLLARCAHASLATRR